MSSIDHTAGTHNQRSIARNSSESFQQDSAHYTDDPAADYWKSELEESKKGEGEEVREDKEDRGRSNRQGSESTEGHKSKSQERPGNRESQEGVWSGNITSNSQSNSNNNLAGFNLDRDFESTLNAALQSIDANPVVQQAGQQHSGRQTESVSLHSWGMSEGQSAYQSTNEVARGEGPPSGFRDEGADREGLVGVWPGAGSTGHGGRTSAGTAGSAGSAGAIGAIGAGGEVGTRGARPTSGWKGYVARVFPNIFEALEEARRSPRRSTRQPRDRVVYPGMPSGQFASNAISNAKYNALTFLPMTLYEQFKFFFNLYFLLVALSQAIPALRIGYLSSYVVPLAFVLAVTLCKEAADDIGRRRRDSEQNNERYEVVGEEAPVKARDLKCGDVVRLHKGVRVPADVVLVQSSESSGEVFVKTDQLDGETDWKLRVACPVTQGVPVEELRGIRARVGPPSKSIHGFVGQLHRGPESIGLTVDNTAWANTVVASGTAVGLVVYTGRDTRQAMNTSAPRAKTGLLELEINGISKILCASVFVLSVGLVAATGFQSHSWYLDVMRFLILFSTIIPVSLRVNLDLGKSVYAHQIQHDRHIPGTVVRTSTIPEDLGRIEYLLSDKTGTLTRNVMELKKLHLGSVSYAGEALEFVSQAVARESSNAGNAPSRGFRASRASRAAALVLTLAVCHNVTPTYDSGDLEYQASSPDEIAIVQFTQAMGLALVSRDRHGLALRHGATGKIQKFDILQTFPFSSDTKRMGIVVRDVASGQIWFMEKGADTVMAKIVEKNDWLEEEASNMAREGLRTLVVGRKRVAPEVYGEFAREYRAASLSMAGRDAAMAAVVSRYLEHSLELQGLTGVEDRLQEGVKSSIESLRNAGIKIWMLTGDKVETARCVAVSAKLIARGQYVHTVEGVGENRDEPAGENRNAHLDYLFANPGCCLLIDGQSLAYYMATPARRTHFCRAVVPLPAVIACRCTPQQKADVASLIKNATGKRVCCIGDGGNDVSMIQCADVGVGIVGKEGRQASLAADFSITQFCHLTKLLLWHGRNSYKRSAKLAQFVIHRGLLISVCQAVYSICSAFAPLALFQGWLMVGYATLYTMAPVFSLVLDYDVGEDLVTLYPELYRELTGGSALSYRTFFVWTAVSLYQGGVIQGLAQLFTGLDESLFTSMVALSYSALIINELVMVALEVHTWSHLMAWSHLVTLAAYIGSFPFLSDYFDLHYVASFSFCWQLAFILALSLLPIWGAKALTRRLHPPTYAKVQQA